MGKKGKSTHKVPPAAATAVQPKKVPRVGADTEEYWRTYPVWSFAFLDPVGVFGWTHFKKEDLDELLARFKQWEKMTWGEILSEGRTQNHALDVYRCSSEARERLEVLGLQDQEHLLSLRVNSRARVIGIRNRAIFHILWWDPEHQVCPSAQKGT